MRKHIIHYFRESTSTSLKGDGRQTTRSSRSRPIDRHDRPESRPPGIGAESSPAAAAPIAVIRNPAYTHDMRWHLWLIVLFAVAACKANPYSSVPDENLHAKAKTLALPERYNLYVAVLHSRIPSRPIIADDVAALGPPAWKYVLGRALGGGSAELSEALPALLAFDRRCSSNEFKQLREHADRFSRADTARALNDSIESLCGAGLPAGD